MPLPVYLALITFAPAGCAVLIAALGLALRGGVRAAVPARPVALGLAALGALIPAVGLLIFAPATEANSALWVTLFGGSVGEGAWFSAVYRLDGFGLYAALGIALIVAPLLLWMAWQHGAPPASQEQESTQADAEASDQDQEQDRVREMVGASGARAELPLTLWGGLALALAAETALLTLVFSDNVLWMALAWILLAALAWGLGEIGNPPDTLDWPGLALMLAGPVLWTLIFFIPAVGGKGDITIYPRFTDMMGRGTITPLHALALALALALAAGAYPFLAWVRGRAALITPAGLAALALVVMPAALFVGGRLYSAAQDGTGAWQQIGKAVPPITGGIFFTVIGAVTVAIAGLMALERRDSRALIAYLAVAQAGWGFVALGLGAPAAITGLVVLLATSTFGLGAMLAAIYAGGTLTSDLEPDAAGPRPFGAPIAPVRLAAWCVGALALVGAPLCAGFVGRQLIAAGAIEARGLLIPLTALAWAGDALLGLALLRATAPAFTALLGIAKPAAAESVEANGMHPAVAEDETPAETSAPAPTKQEARSSRALALLSEVPAVVLALLAVIVAVAPQLLLAIGAIPAVGALLPPAQVNTVTATQLGYATDGVQVLPTLAWGAFVIFFALRIFLVPGGARQTRPVALAGLAPSEPAPVPVPAVAGAAEGPDAVGTEDERARELVGLPEPADAWADLGLAFRSGWTLPGAEWLVRGVEEESGEIAPAAETENDAEVEEAEAEPETEVEQEAATEPEVEAAHEVEAEAETQTEAAVAPQRDGDEREDVGAGEARVRDDGAEQTTMNGSAAATPAPTAGTDDADGPDRPAVADAPARPSPVKGRKRGRTGGRS